MIKIFILTDDIEGWTAKLENEFTASKIVKHRNEAFIQTEIFYFHIKKYFSDSMRGYAFSCAIIDKPIDYELERNVLRPCVKRSIITTKDCYLSY